MIKTNNKTIANQLHRSASSLVLATLIGCGGGSNGTNAAGTGPLPLTAPSAPRITAIAPADKDSCVATNDTITVTFSNAMNAASVTSAFHVRDSSGAAVAGTVSYTNQIATFTPQSPFAANSNYTAGIDGTVTDAQGNNLGASYTWTFTTIPPAAVAGNYVVCWNPVSDSRLMQYHLYWDTTTPVITSAAHSAAVTPSSSSTVVPHSYEVSPTDLGVAGTTVYIAVSAESTSDPGATSTLSDPITIVVQ